MFSGEIESSTSFVDSSFATEFGQQQSGVSEMDGIHFSEYASNSSTIELPFLEEVAEEETGEEEVKKKHFTANWCKGFDVINGGLLIGNERFIHASSFNHIPLYKLFHSWKIPLS